MLDVLLFFVGLMVGDFVIGLESLFVVSRTLL